MNKVLSKVSVVTITYGHEKYITETLDGVLMQQYEGPVEFIIANDNSQDATDEVVKKYFSENPAPSNFEIKYTKHETNKGMMPNFIWALEQATGEYIALCEGDDYWIDPLKLQKQIDFLEENEDFGLVHTQISYNLTVTGEELVSTTDRSKNSFEELIYKNCIATLTTCLRTDLVIQYINEVDLSTKSWVAGDLPMWLWFALHSKIHYIDEVTSMYRVIPGSVSNTTTSRKYFDFIKSRLSIKQYFIDNYYPNTVLEQFIKNDFLKDAEFHALKLREIDVLQDLKERYKNENFIKYLFFASILKNRFFYKTQFDVYRLFNKTVATNKKYSI